MMALSFVINKQFMVLMLFWILIISTLWAEEKPNWVFYPPNGYINDFFVGSGNSRFSETEARTNALGNAILKITQNGNIQIYGEQNISSETTEKMKDGNSISFDNVSKIVSEIKITGESTTISGLKEEEYFTEYADGLYTVWCMVKIPKRVPRNDMPPTKFDALWRSTIAPSWGQFYKGEPTKGYCIAFSIAALIPGGIIFDNLKTTAQSDANSSRTQALRDYYVDQANNYKDLKVACYALAGATYVYSIVDAIASSGEKVYVESEERKLTPLLTYSSRGLDVGIAIHF